MNYCVHYPPAQASLLFLVIVLVHPLLQSHGWSPQTFVNPGVMAAVSGLLANVTCGPTSSALDLPMSRIDLVSKNLVANHLAKVRRIFLASKKNILTNIAKIARITKVTRFKT